MGMASELTTIPVDIAATTVADAAAGDAVALARIVGAYHDDMARVCFVICGDQDVAQDAVQSAWPIAWRKLGTLRDPARLRPWLISIAANEARQAIRRRRRARTVTEIAAVDVPASGADPASNAGLLDLAAALRRLPPDDRALIALRYVADFDATELARPLGLSPSGVRSRLSRLLARLRSELDDD
jgi:RNA polymerase sigma-70 factor, ECF subfamily